jgi:ubiquinone biosynthesis protein UbiJ
MSPYESYLEEKMAKANQRQLALCVMRCIREIKALQEKNTELEKRIERLEGNKHEV